MMEFKTRRLLSFIISGGYLFLGGCEYAVILPTAWDYLQTLGVTDEMWLGFIVSVYSFSAAISGVIGGHLADKYMNQTKNIALFTTGLRIIGSLQYSLGFSVWNVFMARLICGIGTTAGSVMMAEVCRSTSMEERTPILTIFNAGRQLGILVGPAFQILLSQIHFRVTDWWEITPLNSPGVCMALLWFIFELGIIFMFSNLGDEISHMDEEQRHAILGNTSNSSDDARHNNGHIKSNGVNGHTKSNGHTNGLVHVHKNGYNGLNGEAQLIERLENELETNGNINKYNGDLPTSSKPNGNANYGTVKESTRTRKPSNRSLRREFSQSTLDGEVHNLMHTSDGAPTASMLPKHRYMEEFLTDSFVLLFAMVFTIFFCQIGVETVVPVVMENYFGYGDFENSLVYMIGGVEALLIYFVVAFASKYVRDSTLQAIGLGLMLFAQVWFLIVIPMFEHGSRNTLHLSYFLIGIVALYIGYPVAAAANTGLYSKYLSNETQGLGQGLRRLSSFLGLIFGPAWAGSTIKNPHVFLSVPVIMLILNTIMLACSFNKLRRLDHPGRDEHQDEESQSLLRK